MQDMTTEPFSLDSTLRLLILLARLELSVPQQQYAMALCSRIDDWAEVTRQAKQQFVLPLVYRHLRHLSPPSLSSQDAALMRSQCLQILQHNLHVIAEQQRLVRELLDPLEIPYLFFKGPSLAARYYDDPAIRFCRDIDLLVPCDKAVDLLEAALQRNYQAHNPKQLASDRGSLDFAVRTQPVITLISPKGVEIELHKQLDKEGKLYRTDALLEARKPLPFGDTVLWTMPTSELFVYICLHHTRHYWSHLHWLVDLDAIQRHSDFDLDDAYACAEKHGLTTSVAASMELYHALAQPEPALTHGLGENGRSLLNACLATLQGGHEAELALRHTRPTPDFAFSWQSTASYWLAYRLRSPFVPLMPTYTDYQFVPLPPRWQWLYYVIRPWRVLIKLFTPSEPRP
ncbi:nucleotidyltransferase domain-containing protein [Halomonas korlensis]|nr:nucleotidyltransferase family protein [Halomonas korlensis]